MARRDDPPSPLELERQAAERRRATVDEWWLEFCESKPYQSMRTRERWLASFAGYVTRERLFAWQPAQEDCSSVTPDGFRKFFLETAPGCVTVDDAAPFVDALTAWMGWLCRQPGRLTHGAVIENLIKQHRREAVVAMDGERGCPSKELAREAIHAGVDVGNHEEWVDYCLSRSHDVGYLEAILCPPCPMFHKGRALYVWDWPPQPTES